MTVRPHWRIERHSGRDGDTWQEVGASASRACARRVYDGLAASVRQGDVRLVRLRDDKVEEIEATTVAPGRTA